MQTNSEKILQAATTGAQGAWQFGKILLWLRGHIMLSGFGFLALVMLVSGNIAGTFSVMSAYICLRYLYISPFRLLTGVGKAAAADFEARRRDTA